LEKYYLCFVSFPSRFEFLFSLIVKKIVEKIVINVNPIIIDNVIHMLKILSFFTTNVIISGIKTTKNLTKLKRKKILAFLQELDIP